MKILGLIPFFCLALSVSAADESQPKPDRPPLTPEQRDPKLSENDKGEQNLTYRQRMVTGQVTDTKETEVTAEGKTENHFLAKVTTYGNRVVIVDFGQKSALKNEIKAGDEIAAFGITGRLNQLPLVVASKFAHIQNIEGREDIYEAVPINTDNRSDNSNTPTDLATNNKSFSEEALRRSNNNDNKMDQQQQVYNSGNYNNQTYTSTQVNQSVGMCGCR